MAIAGSGNLSPAEVVRRCEDWYGARVEVAGPKFKIYPKDKTQGPVFISDRWTNGTDRPNALAQLRRAGIDVLREPVKNNREDQTVTTPQVPNPTVIPARPAVNGVKPATHADYETVLGMLAEAEQRDQARRAEIAELGRQVESLTKTCDRLDLSMAQSRASLARAVKKLNEAEDRLLAAGAMPQTEAARIEAERAELTDKAIALLESLPPAAAMTAGSIAASLGRPDKGNALGKLLAVAAKEGRVSAVKMGVQKIYRAVPRGDA